MRWLSLGLAVCWAAAALGRPVAQRQSSDNHPTRKPDSDEPAASETALALIAALGLMRYRDSKMSRPNTGASANPQPGSTINPANLLDPDSQPPHVRECVLQQMQHTPIPRGGLGRESLIKLIQSCGGDIPAEALSTETKEEGQQNENDNEGHVTDDNADGKDKVPEEAQGSTADQSSWQSVPEDVYRATTDTASMIGTGIVTGAAALYGAGRTWATAQ